MTGPGANEGELTYADGGWEDELLDPPTERDVQEWTEPEPGFDPFRPLSLLRQLESGQWVRIGRDEAGRRLVQDLFGRALPTCAECGMCAAEWAVETERDGNPAVPCCDGE